MPLANSAVRDDDDPATAGDTSSASLDLAVPNPPSEDPSHGTIDHPALNPDDLTTTNSSTDLTPGDGSMMTQFENGLEVPQDDEGGENGEPDEPDFGVKPRGNYKDPNVYQETSINRKHDDLSEEHTSDMLSVSGSTTISSNGTPMKNASRKASKKRDKDRTSSIIEDMKHEQLPEENLNDGNGQDVDGNGYMRKSSDDLKRRMYISNSVNMESSENWEETLKGAIKAVVSIKATRVRSFDTEMSGILYLYVSPHSGLVQDPHSSGIDPL